ncbi:phytanoyl-CoA dioxygenase family protein [Sphingomonas sp. PL-96]|uniref:phytanoyl-CoA dioxygenase family protein n=1 Tax=Sphingomonas sp. PL-96 TaxID=2887201 RepID=UPI001E422FB4|nr:phytanoyl-CoA dioxygenase family protein [Sphingomonas sp. PL-96]MCC2975414.1 phytanoyl-CoA dioxygenase family protein [Sphingomonas sp. PL-96]
MVLPSLPRVSDTALYPDAATVAATVGALRRDGFAVVEGLFARADLCAVERMLDDAFEAAAQIPAARRFVVRYPAGDRADGGADGVGTGWDQLELNHATALVPALLETKVFQGCATLARALAGPVTRSFDHVIYKGPRNRTPTPWHQDAAFKLWRGSQPRQLHFWIPLQDVTQESGCMEFIAGSHRAPLLHHRRMLRSSGLPGREASPDTPDSIPCPLALGGLTIHTPTTLHCAGANASTVPRKAWILQFAPWGNARLAVKRLAGAVPRPLPQQGTVNPHAAPRP